MDIDKLLRFMVEKGASDAPFSTMKRSNLSISIGYS
jgi:hypothetical protein